MSFLPFWLISRSIFGFISKGFSFSGWWRKYEALPFVQSFRLLIEAQILRAGPSLMFIVDMRCSSLSSISACPSISCDRNWDARSSQPDKWFHKWRIIWNNIVNVRRNIKLSLLYYWPWRDEMNWHTSCTLQSAGLPDRKWFSSTGSPPGAASSSWGPQWVGLGHEKVELGESDMKSSSSSPSQLEMSSERLDSERHCERGKDVYKYIYSVVIYLNIYIYLKIYLLFGWLPYLLCSSKLQRLFVIENLLFLQLRNGKLVSHNSHSANKRMFNIIIICIKKYQLCFLLLYLAYLHLDVYLCNICLQQANVCKFSL